MTKWNIGNKSRHLYMRIEKHKYSVIGRHLKDKHNQTSNSLHEHFTTVKKCRGKFECLIYEMLIIRKNSPTLNIQNDSNLTKLFYLNFSHSFVYVRFIYSNAFSNFIFLIDPYKRLKQV